MRFIVVFCSAKVRYGPILSLNERQLGSFHSLGAKHSLFESTYLNIGSVKLANRIDPEMNSLSSFVKPYENWNRAKKVLGTNGNRTGRVISIRMPKWLTPPNVWLALLKLSEPTIGRGGTHRRTSNRVRFKRKFCSIDQAASDRQLP